MHDIYNIYTLVKPDGELDVLEIHFPLDYVRGKNASSKVHV